MILQKKLHVSRYSTGMKCPRGGMVGVQARGNGFLRGNFYDRKPKLRLLEFLVSTTRPQYSQDRNPPRRSTGGGVRDQHRSRTARQRESTHPNSHEVERADSEQKNGAEEVHRSQGRTSNVTHA